VRVERSLEMKPAISTNHGVSAVTVHLIPSTITVTVHSITVLNYGDSALNSHQPPIIHLSYTHITNA